VLSQFPQVDYIRLYAKAPAPFSYLGLTASRRHLVRFKHPVFGTQGYLLRRAGAERFLRNLSEVVRPIDDEMDRFWINGVPIVAVYPFPLTEIGFETTIGMTRHAPPPLGLAAGTRRFAWRALEKARRHTYNARLALPNRGA
jgi:glycosyl transferase family 25